ncbi:MAG: hypothetical protein ACE5IB_06610 [Candidatus Geothermarchaeales archaeon]
MWPEYMVAMANGSMQEGTKITVELSRKGLQALDALKETSGYGSRGRTIEEAVITIAELVGMTYTITEMLKDPERSQSIAPQGVLSLLMVFLTKLARFG